MTPKPHVLIVGKSRADRLEYADASAPATDVADAATLPFRRVTLSETSGPRTVRIDDVELAFPDVQTSGTRLILTQPAYLVQQWLDSVSDEDRIILTGNLLALKHHAPDAFEGSGPWRHFLVIDLHHGDAGSAAHETSVPTDHKVTGVDRLLVEAFRSASPVERASLCRQAVSRDPQSATAWLALASACRETQDVNEAREALDRALGLAPDWEAAHYEDGKFWLACEDLERARASFARACLAMPTLTTAWSNLGATLGELDRPDEALGAFQHALVTDPGNFMVLNNIGVVTRELGRLDESEAALTRVNEIAPDFVFAHYNLGHTRLLARRFDESHAAYEEGWRRDPQKNRRQGCRLAIVRLLCGHAQEATTLLWESANRAPADEREDLLLEAFEIVRMFVPEGQATPAQAAFLDDIADAVRRS